MKNQIMKKAWEIKKVTGLSFSECLKIAWSVFNGNEEDGEKLQKIGVPRSVSKLIQSGTARNYFNKKWDDGLFKRSEKITPIPQDNNHPYGVGSFNAMRL